MKHTYLHTGDALTVVLAGRAYTVSAHHKHFDALVHMVKKGEDADKLLRVMETQKNAVMGLLKHTFVKDLGDNLVYDEGVIYFHGQPLQNNGALRLVELIEMGHDYQALANFIKKLGDNPLPHVVDELFDFLTHGRVPLTPEGDFLVYKAVRGDYKDIHSGHFLNSVGQVVEIPREDVDPDRQQTCSYGLHVCSFAYLPHFSHANGHVMMCRVNPRDVVAVPADYNNTKMRVCRYQVVEEVTSYYNKEHDILGESLLANERYEVWYRPHGLYVDELSDTFYTMDEAQDHAIQLQRQYGVKSWVRDTQRQKEMA
jgi:hypothetical protein